MVMEKNSPEHTMGKHFAEVAPVYDDIRFTDVEPILTIESIVGQRPIKVIDVGCGSGRYTTLLLEHLNIKELIAVDESQAMLDQLRLSLPDCITTQSKAESIPLPSGEYDLITTFNAVHHFDSHLFLTEAKRLLTPGGLLMIYTRTPEQNEQTIWGQHFPMFADAETRLMDNATFYYLALLKGFDIEGAAVFTYDRTASLQELITKARAFHYSTFRLIPEDSFEACLESFRNNVLKHADDESRISWVDSNILYVLRR